jgi:hypothetical protein
MTANTTEAPDKLLERIRKLLAKAEDPAVTPAESQAFTAKAAEWMAKYGIDRALLAASGKQADKPGSRMFAIPDPYARAKDVMLFGIATAMRCQAIELTGDGSVRMHVFGWESDLERVDVLYTSLLIQMSHGLAVAEVPALVRQQRQTRSWNRSWLLGFAAAVTERVKAAEAAAVAQSQRENPGRDGGMSTELVLADRSLAVRSAYRAEYPRIRKVSARAGGSGYGAGHAKGQRADLGAGRVAGSSKALGR